MLDALLGIWVAAAFLVLLLIQFFWRPAQYVPWLAVVMAAPLFFKVTGGSIELGDPIVAGGSGQTFPVSVLAVIMTCGLMVLKFLKEGVAPLRSPLSKLVLMFIFWNVLVFLAGWLLGGIRVENLLFLAQTLGPALCFFVPLVFFARAQRVRDVRLAVVTAVGTWLMLLIGFALATQGIDEALGGIGPWLFVFPIYTLYDYVPLLVTVAYGLALSLLWGGEGGKWRPILFLYLVSMLSFLLVGHSRGSLITALLITVMLGAHYRWRSVARGPGGLVAVIVVGVAVTALIGPHTRTVQRFQDLRELGSEEVSLITRLAVLSLGVDEVMKNPAGGVMYMASPQNDVGDFRLLNPHNQYVTYALRGGIVSLVLFLAILARWHRRMFALARISDWAEVRSYARGLGLTLLAVNLVSNMFQDNFIQPYTGNFLWLLLGLGEAVYLVDQRAVRLRRSVGHVTAPMQSAHRLAAE